MIFIKYIDKYDATNWHIYMYNEGNKTQKCIKTSRHGIVIDENWIGKFNPEEESKYYNIKYLTEAVVDLLKLELL